MLTGRQRLELLICLHTSSGMLDIKENETTGVRVQGQNLSHKRIMKVQIRALNLEELVRNNKRTKT